MTETTWHHTQETGVLDDGGVALTFRVDGLTEIPWWVLGWAGRAQVVRPPELRAVLVDQLRLALQMHESRFPLANLIGLSRPGSGEQPNASPRPLSGSV